MFGYLMTVTFGFAIQNHDLFPEFGTAPFGAHPSAIVEYLRSEYVHVPRFDSLEQPDLFRNLLVKFGPFDMSLATKAVKGYFHRATSLKIVPTQVGRDWSKLPDGEVVMVEFKANQERMFKIEYMIDKNGNRVLNGTLARRLEQFAPSWQRFVSAAFRIKD
jgi:hypothetical protein